MLATRQHFGEENRRGQGFPASLLEFTLSLFFSFADSNAAAFSPLPTLLLNSGAKSMGFLSYHKTHQKGRCSMETNTLNWSKLPDRLRYLAPLAEKYGRLQFDERILDYLNNHMSEEDRQELIDLGKTVVPDLADINSWINQFDMTEHQESALVYFALYLIGLGNAVGVFDTWPWVTSDN
jgi:hypothetical protein